MQLAGMALVEGSKRGKTMFLHTKSRGRNACQRYRQVRETCLMPGVAGTAEENARVGGAASLLRTLSGRPKGSCPRLAGRRAASGVPQ